MTRHDDAIRLRHMVDYALKAIRFAEGRRCEDFATDEMFLFATVRAVEIVGEAANRVSLLIHEQHPEIPWRQIVGARNRFIHGYDSVDYRILWDIVTIDLPRIVESLRGILEELES